MSRQSPKLTAQSFAVVKNHQKDGRSVEDIQAKTGYGASTQRAVWRAADWKDFERRKRARVLKRRTKASAERTRKRAEVRQQIIERNQKRKAVEVAIADQIETNRVYALEEKVKTLGKEVAALRKRVKTLGDPELRLERLIAQIPEDQPLDPDFLLADVKPQPSGRTWPWTRKRG